MSLPDKVVTLQEHSLLFRASHEDIFNPKYGKFGLIIFPAEFFMHIISPVMVIAFILLLSKQLFEINIYALIVSYLAIAFLYVLSYIKKIVIIEILLSFLNSQLTLLISLIYHILGITQYKWKKIDEVRPHKL